MKLDWMIAIALIQARVLHQLLSHLLPTLTLCPPYCPRPQRAGQAVAA